MLVEFRLMSPAWDKAPNTQHTGICYPGLRCASFLTMDLGHETDLDQLNVRPEILFSLLEVFF